MGKLQESKFPERNVQHDLTLTPSTNTAHLWPKHLISQHDYHMMTQNKVCDMHEHDTYRDSYTARQHEIRLDAMLSWQIQADEQKWLAEHIKQIENETSLEYTQNKRRNQTIQTPFQIDMLMTKDWKNIILKTGPKIKTHNSQDSFRDKKM